MPSILLLRMAGTIPDVPPRWLLAAADMIFEPVGRGRTVEARPFSIGALVPGPGRDLAALGLTGRLGATGPGIGGDAHRPGAPAPARSPDDQPPDSAITTWRLGWLDDDTPPPGWPPVRIRFGSQARTVVGSERHRYSYADLARSRPARGVRLTMNTPTYFSRGGRNLPLPEPALVVGGLVARWNRYAPASLRIGAGDARAIADAVFLDGFWGSSAEVELGHGLRQVGFVGQADLRLLADTSDYTATMFTALARFAAIAGVGEHTSHGFGAVDVEVEAEVDAAGLTPAPRQAAQLAVPTSRRSERTPARSPATRTTKR